MNNKKKRTQTIFFFFSEDLRRCNLESLLKILKPSKFMNKLQSVEGIKIKL